MHIVFIRHGESTGNIGLPCPDMSRMELTERGRRQARHLANTWTVTPTLIVVSPFLRTQQTAQPTRERFPAVPVEEWGIEEFTYLEPSRWNGSAYSDRLPSIEGYWRAVDPNYCDGPGAETFATLLRRAEATLKRLQTLIGHHPTVFLFSHGQFMQAIRITILYSEASDQEKMHLFLENNACPAFQNAELFQLYMDVGGASNAIFSTRSFEKPDRPNEQGQQLDGKAPDPAETFKDESSPNPLSKEQLEKFLNNFLNQRFKIAETQAGITAFSEGMPRQKALLDFQSSVNRADTIFSTDHWLLPKLAELATLLSDPISAAQAQGLDDVLHGRHFMKELIEWLESSHLPWADYFEDLNAQEKRREALERGQRIAWGEAQRKKWTGAPLAELCLHSVGTMVRGHALAGAGVPESAKEFPSFLAWWFAVGKFNPDDSTDWMGISGPWATNGSVELISDEEWAALDAADRALVTRWIDSLGCILYD